MVFIILFCIFLLATLVQLCYWCLIFSKLAYYTPPPLPDEEQPPVSVIICARNEEKNLEKNLSHFLNQNYRFFEIIVVNDHSEDKTAEVVLNFQKKYANLRLVNCNSSHRLPGKKQALTIGIEAARYDIIALSDADCQPASPDWLLYMQRALRQNVEIGLGYSPYQQTHRELLNLFIRFETIYTAVQYLSFALIGLPYMGVGRNLIYTKSIFSQTRGFQQHNHIASGDDDLFINEAVKHANVQIVIHPGAFVFSEPKRTWRGYYRQKSRHLSTATSYQWKHQVMLGALSLSHALHYLLAILLIVSGTFVIPTLITVLVRMAVVSWTYYKVLKQLQDPALLKWTPLLDAGYVLYYLVFAPALLIGRKDVWKQ